MTSQILILGQLTQKELKIHICYSKACEEFTLRERVKASRRSKSCYVPTLSPHRLIQGVEGRTSAKNRLNGLLEQDAT